MADSWSRVEGAGNLLPRPNLSVTEEWEQANLLQITTRIEALERELRYMQRLIGERSSTLPDSNLPDIAEIRAWSNFSSVLLAKYRDNADRQIAKAKKLYYEHVHVKHHIRILDVTVDAGRRHVHEIRMRAWLAINQITRDAIRITHLHNGVLRSLDGAIDEIVGLRLMVIDRVRKVATAIDWLETVAKTPTPPLEEARSRHAANLSAIRQLGTERMTDGSERVPAGALAVADRALRSGTSVAFGEDPGDPALRTWLARHMKDLKEGGAGFLQLPLPKPTQQHVNEFLTSRGTVEDQDRFIENLESNGWRRSGWSNDQALIDLIQAAHRSGLPVVAGGTSLKDGSVRGDRAIVEPYMAAIHNENVAKYGPGVLVADRLNTNITNGVDSYIPRIITLDQLSPGHAGITASVGEAIVFPWNGSHADYRSLPEGTDDPERFMRDNDNSTLVFDPALSGSPRR